MELEHLREFAAVARYLNFTEAADKLHVSQPTLSKHITALEHEMGVTLFNRTPSRVTLTKEGFYLLGVASNVTNIIDNARKDLAAIKSQQPIYVEGRFEDSAISGLISSTSRLCAERGLAPVLFNHSTEKTPLTLLLDGDIDAIIDMLPDPRYEAMGLATKGLFSQPIVIVMEKDHPLADASSLAIRDLKDVTFCQLLWDHYEAGWRQIEGLCLSNGFEPKRVPQPVRSLAEGLSVPLGNSVLPFPGNVEELRYISASGRVCVPLTDSNACFTTCVTYRKDNAGKLAGFLDALFEARKGIAGRVIVD